VCCSVWQRVAVCGCVAVAELIFEKCRSPDVYSMLQCVARCCSVLQCVVELKSEKCGYESHLSEFAHQVASFLPTSHVGTHCNTLQHTATHCNTLPHTATQSHLSEFARQVASSLPSPHTHSTTSTSSPTPLDRSSLKGRGGRGGGRSRGTLISAAESQGVCVGVGVKWVCVCV